MLNLKKLIMEKNDDFDNNTMEVILTMLQINDDELNDIKEIDNKKIHESVYLPKAYMIEDFIVGFTELNKLMYYVGAEDENELVLKIGDLYVYRIDNEDRFPVIE